MAKDAGACALQRAPTFDVQENCTYANCVGACAKEQTPNVRRPGWWHLRIAAGVNNRHQEHRVCNRRGGLLKCQNIEGHIQGSGQRNHIARVKGLAQKGEKQTLAATSKAPRLSHRCGPGPMSLMSKKTYKGYTRDGTTQNRGFLKKHYARIVHLLRRHI